MSRLEILATVVDCEGCIGVGKTDMSRCSARATPYYFARVTVDMTKPYYVRLFRKAFGGRIKVRKRKGNRWKPVFVWSLSAKQAIDCIRTLTPYLKLKQKQAKLCLELQKLRDKFGRTWGRNTSMSSKLIQGFERLYKQSHLLNKRGP